MQKTLSKKKQFAEKQYSSTILQKIEDVTIITTSRDDITAQ